MRKSLALVAVFVLVVLGGLVLGFLATGGIGLVRLYRYYLSQDIPDKKYSWIDFTDRGPREILSGYYAGSVGDSFFMWTFSGLKRFVHSDGTSVYYYLDTCDLVRRLEAGEVKNISPEKHKGDNTIIEARTYSLVQWRSSVRTGDYVWVKRVGEKGEERKIIDKAWANSNKYFPLTQLKVEQCKN